MNSTPDIPSFGKFIAELRRIWREVPGDGARMRAAREPMRDLLADPAIGSASEAWPSTEGRRNLLFYEDPEHGFVINGVVREPGRHGGIHDHDRAWVLYGVLTGEETLERYARDEDRRSGRTAIRRVAARPGRPGTIDLVPPFDIHAEQGGPGRSVAVILGSARIAGRGRQGSYDARTGECRRVEGPEQIPYRLTG